MLLLILAIAFAATPFFHSEEVVVCFPEVSLGAPIASILPEEL